LKKVREFPRVNQAEKKAQPGGANPIVFCEKTTGIMRFRSATESGSDVALERAAGMLAMQCLVRGHDPTDFEILVPADTNLAQRVSARANELLKEGRAISSPPILSARQKEILHSVLCNRANKEIASKLNITVRTVKFHISTLLEKFDAGNRSELAQRASVLLRPAILEPEGLSVLETAAHESRRDFGPMPVPARGTYRLRAKARSVRFPGRILTA
jgi:DNA-binding CsgD family transcriptional regulator